MASVLKRALGLAVLAAALAARSSAQEFSVSVESARPLAPAAVPTLAAAASPALSPTLALTAAPGLLSAPAASPCAAFPSAVPAAAASGWNTARLVAERLGRARGVPVEDHAIFYENLARYVYNSADDAALAELAARPGRVQASDVSSLRWSGRLERDLRQPYDDAAALARLDRLQEQLEDLVRWLRVQSPRGGYSILIMGGILRGRISAHSDLDVMLETDDAQLLNAALASPFGYLTKKRDVAVGPVPRNARLRASLGETVDVGDGASVLGDAFVRELYFRARAAVAAAPMRRDAPLDEAAMVAIKRLGRRLDETRDAVERARLEDRIDVLAAALPPFAAPAAPGRYVRLGDVRVDLNAPGAAALLQTVGSKSERPVIGIYSYATRRVLSAAALGRQGVTGHESIRPVGFERNSLLGWSAALSPNGQMRFTGSGAMPGAITPGLRRKIRRYLGVSPAEETPGERLARALRERWAALLARLQQLF